jgi:hypothetical protein
MGGNRAAGLGRKLRENEPPRSIRDGSRKSTYPDRFDFDFIPAQSAFDRGHRMIALRFRVLPPIGA